MTATANIDVREELAALAKAMLDRAKDKDTKLEDAVKVFREVREFLALTRPVEKGDKPTGRRPTTISGMRKRIDQARGDEDGRAKSHVQDSFGRA